MNSKAYWEKRAAERMVGYAADAEKTANTLGKAYQSVSAYLSEESAKVLKSFGNAFDLSEAEARRILSDLPDEKMTAALKAAVGNIADPQKRKEAEALISSPAYAYRMNRLKELDEKTSELCERLYNAEVKTDSKFFSAEIDKAYKQTVFDVQKGTGISSAFDLVPQSRIDKILNTQWSGEHFSKRVWGNTQALADGLKNDMLVGIMSGKSEQRMAEDIMNRCAVGAFEARRLVRTETTYISNQAELEGYKELDIEKYEFSACLDNRTSELCSDLDGKVFDVKDAVPGKNLPPMHPFCRSTTLPVLPSEEDIDRELAELGDEIGADVDFDEWVKGLEETEDGKVVYRDGNLKTESPILNAGKNVDKTYKSDIIKNKEEFNPLPQSSVVNVLRNMSVAWIKALTDDEVLAIRKYTKNSVDPKGMEFFRRLNAMLRGESPIDKTLLKYSGLISSALKKSVIDCDILCYRSTKIDVMRNYNVGDIYYPSQFLSTAVTKRGVLKGGYLIIIRVKKGTKGAYIEKLSTYPAQREFLLDKENAYRIISKENKTTVIEVII